MLQFNMFAEREIDPFLHSGADDLPSKLFVIAIVKLMPGKLPLNLVSESDEKRRDVVPKKIDELIIGHDDEDVRLGLLEIGTQSGERGFGIPSELFLLF
jgi:hypothetical protein